MTFALRILLISVKGDTCVLLGVNGLKFMEWLLLYIYITIYNIYTYVYETNFKKFPAR